MNALEGSPGERAAACVDAGCDVALPCNGVMADNIDVAKHVGDLSAAGLERLERAMAAVRDHSDGPDFLAAVATRDELLGLA
jgi:beta-N-acetylhexosaminidase